MRIKERERLGHKGKDSLNRRVSIEGQEASKVAEKELYVSRWGAYKWLNRFDKHGLDGLKDHSRSYRPKLIPEKTMFKYKRDIWKLIWLAGQTSNGY